MEVTLLYCYALESNMEIYQYKLYKKRNAFQRFSFIMQVENKDCVSLVVKIDDIIGYDKYA